MWNRNGLDLLLIIMIFPLTTWILALSGRPRPQHRNKHIHKERQWEQETRGKREKQQEHKEHIVATVVTVWGSFNQRHEEDQWAIIFPTSFSLFSVEIASKISSSLFTLMPVFLSLQQWHRENVLKWWMSSRVTDFILGGGVSSADFHLRHLPLCECVRETFVISGSVQVQHMTSTGHEDEMAHWWKHKLETTEQMLIFKRK